jgi:hypothetical protein
VEPPEVAAAPWVLVREVPNAPWEAQSSGGGAVDAMVSEKTKRSPFDAPGKSRRQRVLQGLARGAEVLAQQRRRGA